MTHGVRATTGVLTVGVLTRSHGVLTRRRVRVPRYSQ